MTRNSYPEWLFDGTPIADPLGYGERAVEFLRRLKHPNSTASKSAFQLYPWQERIVRAIYGPRHPDGRRIVTKVFFMIPRGNRKTSLAAALSLLHTIGPEHIPAGQVIFAANDREQAGVGFNEAANIVRMDKRLIDATRINDATNGAKRITYKKQRVVLQAVSSDGAAQHGRTPSFVLIDEIHNWKKRDLYEALSSGMAKISNTLMVIATTAGRGQGTLGFEEYEYARKVATGEVEDESYLPIIFEAAEKDDWRDEVLWHRVNPGLAYGFPDINGMREAARQSEHRPKARYEFKQFKLNVWQASSRDPLFDMNVYDQGKIDLDLDEFPTELGELPCYLGVDLSRNGDLTAVVAAWRYDDGRIMVHPWFFVPGDDLEARAAKDNVPYVAWKDGELITAIDGPIIEPEIVEDKIRELCADFNVQEIAFDPHLAQRVMQHLVDEGLPAFAMRQGPLTMAPAIGDLERTVNGFKIRHNGHPVLRHHFDSVVASRGDTGLVRMHKAANNNRIDGAVAAAMAVSRACNAETTGSIHDLDPEEFDRLMSAA
ncbi:terminase large subunit [Phyllobacterium zundukense]|uniref:Terminase n=1 Tax=Phyllobacterium zundukense TaxID=1867719 RepID=A0A2N9W456_9HYPH|nr:terminase TerL endonuclease subunit [Phyllobacterium zundukense]ATU92006.1 terminase [Phyllobacterium zundukense]PIO46524.1 terminase [Phyllobacterium zundukense]